MRDAEWSIAVRVALHLGVATWTLDLATRSRALAVVGASGAGKSTVLRVLAGLEHRARGTIAVGGEVWQDSAARRFVPAWKRRVGWVPQDAGLFPHASVRENLGWSGAARGEVARVAAALEVDGLLERRPRNLSGGERQRVALGRALLARPRLLLLDEPFAALDRPLRARLAGVLAALCRAQELPLVLVSHDAHDVAALADETWTLAGGTLQRDDAPTTAP